MIKVKIKKNNHKIDMITISGHANYDENGKDIVCAAVSSTVITTVNNILSLANTIEHIEKKDNLIIKVVKEDNNTYKILDNMISMLYELESDYPKYIKIFEEV